MSSLSSPCHPCHPHIIPIAPRRSLCGPHGLWSLWSPHVVPWSLWSPHVVPVVSVVSTCCPHDPHVIPVIPVSSLLSPCHPHSPQKAPMWSPWSVVSVVSTCCPRGLHMLSPWSPCRPRDLHIIPMSLMSFPHHLKGLHIIPNPPDNHSTHPLPLWGGGAPNQ